MFTELLFLLVVPSIIGYLRFSLDGEKPDFLINLGKITKTWLEPNSWLSRFTPIFSVVVVVYNLFAWFIYGIISSIEFTAFLFTKLWWLILWMWNEVLHPTLFSLVKLLWHYIIIMFWKLFQFAIKLIPSAFVWKNVLNSFKSILILGGMVTLVWVLSSLIGDFIIIPVLGLAATFYLFQYLIYKSTSFYRPDKYNRSWVKPNLRLNLVWLVISIVSSGILFLVHMYSNYILVSSLGVTLTQVLLPVALLFFIAVMISMTYLPAYSYLTDGNVNIQGFLKGILVRLPKLLFAQTLKAVGLVLVAILPFIIAGLLFSGLSEVTKKNWKEWGKEIAELKNDIPEISVKSDTKYQLKTKLSDLENSLIEDNNEFINRIEIKKKEIEDAEGLKYLIKDNSILTFSGDAYVGESQMFSIPEVKNSTYYEWEIRDVDNDKLVDFIKKYRNTYKGGVKRTIILRYKWKKPGNYIVSIIQSNECSETNLVSKRVTVVKRQQAKVKISAPIGNTIVCAGDKEIYKAQKGFKSYDWTLPDNAKIETDPHNHKITVLWGDTPGTVRVRGNNAKGDKTLWVGKFVDVIPEIGQEKIIGKDIKDETPEVFNIQRPFLFYTLRESNHEIQRLNSQLSAINNEDEANKQAFEVNKANVLVKIDKLTSAISDLIIHFISIVLAMLGFVILAAIALSTIWTYFISFDFDLFNFEQKGKHYWEQLIDENMSKNPNQPLLGWFVLVIPLALLIALGFFAG